MNFLGLQIKFPTFSKNREGQVFYDVTSHRDWANGGSNLDIAMNHPILSPALLFVSKMFSQARFKVIKDSTGKEIKDSPYLKLIDNPNPSQTRGDLLEALLFTEIANGIGVLYTKRNLLTDRITGIYCLDYSLIEFPKSLEKGNLINMTESESYMNQEVVYDKNGENKTIKLKDLMFFYDLPNVNSKNPFKGGSRIDGLRQTLTNTQDSLIAKNIILKSNGKELISGTKEGFPLKEDEKREIEESYQNNYGMAFSRKRGIVLSANVTHKSLHIALRDLGLDESVKTDGNIIYTALHLPKDIISLEAKKTTYNNFKESMASYVQNEMQSTLDGFCAVINKIMIEDGQTLVGDYEHLPIMQFILIERYTGSLKRAEALLAFRLAGLPDEICLELVGMDTAIKLNPLAQPSKESKSAEISEEQEKKVRELIEELL